MALLDALTGNASKTAARNNASAINSGLSNAATAVGQGFGAAGNLLGIRDGGNALSALGAGFDQARTDLTGAGAETQGLLSRIGASYQPMIQGGGAAYGRYLDATGANGAEGSERATASFRSAPGYEFARDQGLDAISRTAAARGGLAGGNATADMLRFSQGLADQSFQQYTQNLGGAAQSYGTGLAGQAGGLGMQANASQNQGGALAALGTGFGLSGAGLYGTGSAQAAQQGLAEAGLQTGAANSLVQNNSALAQSQNQASGNFLNLLGGAAQLLASPVGANGATGTVGGSLLTSMGNYFK